MEGRSTLGGRPEARNDSGDLLFCEAAGIKEDRTVLRKLYACLSENNNLHTGNATFHMQMYTWVSTRGVFFHKVAGVKVPVIRLTFRYF